MNDLQKIGGIAALINALAYIIGIGLVTTLLAPIMEAKPEQYVAFMVNNQTLMTTWHLFIYLIAGVCIVPLALALHARFETNKLAWTTIATAFGLIWAVTVISSGMLLVNNAKIIADLYKEDPTRAIIIYQALSAIERGLGGAIDRKSVV